MAKWRAIHHCQLYHYNELILEKSGHVYVLIMNWINYRATGHNKRIEKLQNIAFSVEHQPIIYDTAPHKKYTSYDIWTDCQKQWLRVRV